MYVCMYVCTYEYIYICMHGMYDMSACLYFVVWCGVARRGAARRGAARRGAARRGAARRGAARRGAARRGAARRGAARRGAARHGTARHGMYICMVCIHGNLFSGEVVSASDTGHRVNETYLPHCYLP